MINKNNNSKIDRQKLEELAQEQRHFFKKNKLIRFLTLPKLYFYIKFLKPSLKKTNLLNTEIIASKKTFFNKKLYGYFWDSNFLHINFFRNLKEKEVPLILYYIKNLASEDTFLDIGANYGFYALLATQFIREKNIHLFEPNPPIFNLLKKTFKKGKVHLNKLALSNKEGDTHFYNTLENLNSGSSGILKNNNIIHKNKTKKITVETNTLDAYCNQREIKPDYIKIDVEGAEYNILLGAKEVLKKHKPNIAIEFWGDSKNNSNHKKAYHLLKHYKYHAYKINQNGNISKVKKINFKKIDGYENFVFIKA